MSTQDGTTEFLSAEDVQHFKKRLQVRLTDLRKEIHDELAKSEDQNIVALAGKVHDSADESAAALIADLDVAIVNLHIEELRDVETALARIEAGRYGECVDCGEPVGEPRLDAYNTAKRCIRCQEHYESTHASSSGPRL